MICLVWQSAACWPKPQLVDRSQIDLLVLGSNPVLEFFFGQISII